MRLVRLITLKPISMLLCASMVFNTSCATSTMKVSYLDGYAWGEKMGYISLNRDSGTPDYGVSVTVSGSTGNLSGYAWSEKLGWIKFAGSCSSGTTGACSGGVYGVITSWRVSVAGSSDGYLVSNIFALLAMSTAFLALSFALKENFILDFKFSNFNYIKFIVFGFCYFSSAAG